MTYDGTYGIKFKLGLKPESLLTVSAWADRHRMLSSVASGEPGLWRTARTPYLKEIMDCLSSSSPVERVVFMKGAQLGGTEAGLCWMGYVIHHAPGPMLMVQPTVEMAKRYSKQRVGPLIDSSPDIRDLVKPARSRDSGNTVLGKEFPGGILLMTGANSAAGLSSMPMRYLFLDEVDRYPGDVNNEGDPVALAIQRTVTFTNRKILMVSTPTNKGFSRIEAAYAESDQRQYWVPCPFCGEMQVLEWKQVRWPKDQRDQAVYYCIHCTIAIQNYQKGWMLERGQWIARNPDAGRIAGFHLSSLYSPHGWTSWADIAIEHGQVFRDPPRLKVWMNTKLGETWEESAEQLDGEGLMARREVFGVYLPAGIVILTAGIDVQDDRLEIEIVGWGRDEESWSVDYRILWGDPSGPAVWKDLDDLLRRPWSHARQMPDLHIRAAAVDTGGHNTQTAYAFCRARQDRRIWAIKGKGGMGLPIWPRRPTRNNKVRVPLFTVGVDAAKEAIYSRLRLKVPGPGYCHFPSDRDAEWFRQLTAERVSTRYVKGRPIREWKKKDSDRNEGLDCRVYAMSALQGLVAMGLQLNKEADRILEMPLKDVDGKPLSKPVRRQPQRQVFYSPWMS
ncbi:MAG: phage terminase large subunit family protein [Magnetococcales bacterium]|nr:phage terminase large subunit family protein [Magnetococcales bacterium]MBF0151541.1 phage terminase large subunit family protein [Magnetococcales bacterium]